MKVPAAVAAVLVAVWLAVKLVLLVIRAVVHALAEAMPFILTAVAVCALAAAAPKLGAWWSTRHRSAGREGVQGVRSSYTVRPTPGAAPAAAGAVSSPVRRRRVSPAPIWEIPESHEARAAAEVAPGTGGVVHAIQRPSLAVGHVEFAKLADREPGGANGGMHETGIGNVHSRADSRRMASPLEPQAQGSWLAVAGGAGMARERSSRALLEACPDARASLARSADDGIGPVQPDSGQPGRVILIERCHGVQVGPDNDQYSAYRVSLPGAVLQSGQELADQLISPDAPWGSDLFGVDTRPDLGIASGAGGSGISPGGIVAGPDGDTLVIVRNSSGVQIGDHNVQHNEFRIRVGHASVQVSQLGVSADRAEDIARLCADPGDRGAARRLAEDIALTAGRELAMDVTARATEAVGDPQIDGWPVGVHDRTGVQVGGPPNRAHITIEVKPPELDTHQLARQLLRSAKELAREPAMHEEPAPQPERGRIVDDILDTPACAPIRALDIGLS